MATAQVLFQRFYCKRSFAAFNVKARAARLHARASFSRFAVAFAHTAHTLSLARSRAHARHALLRAQRLAAAAVFLGAKLEEVQRRCRDVVNTFYRLERRGEGKPLDLLDMFGKARFI
jgi:UDP-N-acetylmuramyl pentapeptide synthase